MPVRHHRPAERVARNAIVAGAGVAGLAALFVTAPIAAAAPPPVTPKVAPDATTDTPTPEAKVDLAPSYGFQKYRVGVQVKDGSYVPEGTTTVGTVLTITDTGPGEDDEPQTTTTTCTTDASTVEANSTASYCLSSFNDRKAARRAAASTTPFDPFEVPFNQQFYAAPGHTVTITQKTVNANLLLDPSVGTIEPCAALLFEGVCTVPAGDNLTIKGTSVVFNDPGLPPVATDDSATTKEGVAVNIAIALNDTPKAPINTVKIVADPKNGTAKLVTTEVADPPPPAPLPDARAAAGSRKLAAVTSYRAIYTPKAGFTGVDTFDYTIATANGTASATVTVTVVGVPVAPSETSGTGASAHSDDDNLAATGTQSGELVGYGAALIAAGGGALAIGRQRRRGRHAG